MDGHKGAVRVLLPVKTKATIASSRVEQFLSDEQSRRTSLVYDDEEAEGVKRLAAMMETEEYLEDVAGPLTEGYAEEGEGGSGANGIVTIRHVTGQIGIGDAPPVEENGVEISEQQDKSLTPPFPLSPLNPQEDTLQNGDHQPVAQQQDQQVEQVSEQDEQNDSDEASKTTATGEEAVNEEDGDTGSREVPVEKLVDIEEEPPPYEFGDTDDDGGEIFGVVKQNGATEREGENLGNGDALESGVYSVPVELDLRPRRSKKPAKKKEEDLYDIPREILPPEILNKLPANYESPSKLNVAGKGAR